jgi:hypothetical protein
VDSRGLIPGSDRPSLFHAHHRVWVGLSQPAVLWAPVAKRPGRKAQHSIFSAEVKFVYLYLHSPIRLHSIALNYATKDKGEVIGFEVFTAVTMKSSVFWAVAPYVSCKIRRFGGMCRLYLQGRKSRAIKVLTSTTLVAHVFFLP